MATSTPAEEGPTAKSSVVTGQGLLEKKAVPGVPALGGISDIAIHGPPGGDRKVLVAGTHSVAILELGTYRLMETTRLNDGKVPFLPHHALDADGDGRAELLREPGPGAPARLFDGAGRLLWSVEAPGRGFARAAWGSIRGDGTLSFLLGSVPSSKVSLLDHSGKVIWSQAWERGMSEILILDTDADGKAEILSIDGKALSVRDGNGKVLRRQPIEGASYVNHLGKARYPDRNGRPSLVVGFNIQKPPAEPRQLYRILALDGTLLAEIEPERLEDYLETQPVKLEAGRGPFHARISETMEQALFAGFSATRLVLSIHGPDGPLVYRESIRSSEGEVTQGGGALAVVPASDGTERLLVGYGPDLWEYRLAGK
jgi:hypothetical protein